MTMRHLGGTVALSIGTLVALSFACVFFSPWAVIVGLVGVLGLVLTARFPLVGVAGVLLYLPFETLALKIIPDLFYSYARFAPEVLLYLVAVVVLVRLLRKQIPWQASLIDLPMLVFLAVLLVSILVNSVSPEVALLGSRQILRFPLICFLVWYLRPSLTFFWRFTVVMFVVAGLESFVGVAQHFFGGVLDPLLLPQEPRTVGSLLIKGVEQTWEAGERVFATFGRYDRLGNFLAFFLVLATAVWYEFRGSVVRKEVGWLLMIGLPALVFTFSRASWISFVLGAAFVAVVIYRDRRVMAAGVVGAVLLAGYLGVSQLNVRFLTDQGSQTVVERLFEAFSWARWRGEYYGFGRLYWIVQTPLTVVPAAFFVGHGPGMYGAGAAAILGSTAVYERLSLPFGVYATEGYIDNNWFALWGETGTLGLVAYASILFLLFFRATQLHHASHDPMIRALTIGYAGALIGYSFNGGLSTIFEIRTIAPYVWMYGGMILVFSDQIPVRRPRLLFERL